MPQPAWRSKLRDEFQDGRKRGFPLLAQSARDAGYISAAPYVASFGEFGEVFAADSPQGLAWSELLGFIARIGSLGHQVIAVLLAGSITDLDAREVTTFRAAVFCHRTESNDDFGLGEIAELQKAHRDVGRFVELIPIDGPPAFSLQQIIRVAVSLSYDLDLVLSQPLILLHAE